MRKPSKPSASPTEITVDDVLDEAVETLSFSVKHLRTKIVAIADGKAEKTKHDDESRIAHLASKVGSVVDAMRKVENMRKRRLEALTLATVTAFLRQCSDDDRARIARELEAMKTRGGVLG
jgi:hypothetical protein